MVYKLSYDDREVFLQTIAEARHAITDRQFQCWILHWVGYEQAEIAEFMGISQSAVCQHFQSALEKVGRIGKRYLYEG